MATFSDYRILKKHLQSLMEKTTKAFADLFVSPLNCFGFKALESSVVDGPMECYKYFIYLQFEIQLENRIYYSFVYLEDWI